jgi:D-alanyl-D-alanine carboxypeptidase
VANGSQRLTGEAGDALVEMFASAASEGLQLLVSSAYRSYSDQVATYQYWVNTVGPEEAARTSARPGHSEHQLGTTVDLTSASVGYALVEAFGETAEGRWLAERCWTFGFFISYPAGKEAVTGYAYEPWHFRFVGNTVASSVRATGLTLHEYLLR